MLLPLISKFTPKQVEDMISYSGFPVLMLNTISKNTLLNASLIQNMTFDQSEPYLEKLDWESGSTIINNLALMLILVILAIFNLLVNTLYCLTKSQNNCFQRFILKAYKFFTFSVYIRIFYETFLFLALMSVYEISNFRESIDENGKKDRKYVSLIFSWIILNLLVLFIGLTLLSWVCNMNTLDVDQDK